MRLEISNFAKIGYADLEFNGITVIAGENNTGKTTVGKVLYSLFNSFCDLEGQIDRRKADEIHRLCTMYLKRYMVMNTRVSDIEKNSTRIITRAYDEIYAAIADEICNIYPEEFSIEILTDVIYNALEENDLVRDKQFERVVEELYDKLISVVKIDRWKVALEIVFQFFDVNFASQIQSLKYEDDKAQITLTIKDNPIKIEMTGDSIEIDGNINVMHEAYFLDDPFVIDKMRTVYLGKSGNNIRPRDFLVSKLKSCENQIDNVFDTVYAKEKIKEIMHIINDVVPGEISSKSGKWTLSSTYFEKPIDFYNLSAGLKSFVIIKMLLEKGILKEKDVLILDEPEIHLHPEWQLKYAEIIVLLQKLFDLNIVVTTHSRDFFEAIDLYSQKYLISEKCNYYLAKQSDGISTFEDVTNDTTKIYSQLIKPSRLLDKLRFELEDE